MTCNCIKCDKEIEYNWYCEEHYLEKEFGYARFDINNNPEYLKAHKDYTFNRLMAWVEYRQKEGN